MHTDRQVGLFSIFDWAPPRDREREAEVSAQFREDYRTNPLGLIGFLLALPFLAVGAAVVAIVYVITRPVIRWVVVLFAIVLLVQVARWVALLFGWVD